MPEVPRAQRFTDRDDAGRRLAGQLAAHRGRDDVVVVGLPRGGLVVAARVAEELAAPLDVVIVVKITAAGRDELALGAVALWGDRVEVVRNDALLSGSPRTVEVFDDGLRRALAQARRRFSEWGQNPRLVRGCTVLVVDDGLATGATARAAIAAIRDGQPAAVVLAVPVCSRSGRAEMSTLADEVVCPLVPHTFRSVSQFYVDFSQVDDTTVERELCRAANRVATSHPRTDSRTARPRRRWR